MNSFRDDSVSDLLVDDDSNGSGVDVEDSSSSAVVVLVGHTFMNGSIDNNVNDISNFVGGESLSDVNGSMLFKSFSEFMSSSSFISIAVSHGYGQSNIN